jgi:hypothetical protein
MPDVVRGHTNAAAIMIGERAADLIRYGGSPAAAGLPVTQDSSRVAT